MISELPLHFTLSLGTHQTSQKSSEARCPDNEDTIAPTGLILRQAGTGQESNMFHSSMFHFISIYALYIILYYIH